MLGVETSPLRIYPRCEAHFLETVPSWHIMSEEMGVNRAMRNWASEYRCLALRKTFKGGFCISCLILYNLSVSKIPSKIYLVFIPSLCPEYSNPTFSLLLQLHNQQNRTVPHDTPLIPPIQALIRLILKPPAKAHRSRTVDPPNHIPGLHLNSSLISILNQRY